MIRTHTLRRPSPLRQPLAIAALAGTLVLTGCASDDSSDGSAGGEPAATSSNATAASDVATPVAEDPQVVADAVNAALGVLVDETLAMVEADLPPDAMDDFPAFAQEWFPQTHDWVAWDTFASETHGYALLRTLVGVAALSVGLSDDHEAAAADLREGFTAEPDWVSFSDGIATVADPEAADEEMLPVTLVEREGSWLFDGSTYTDAWFAEQGLTPEEALS